jgi:hypothetical protein
MVQLCGPGAIQGAPAGPAGPAGIRAGPRVRLAKQFYPENPDIDAQGAYINTRSALFGDGVQLRGVGRPGAIQGAPAGPAGPAGIRAGPQVRLAKQFYPENPDIDAQGAYINTRSALFGDGVQLRGVGRPEAIQGAPAGPAGPAGVCTGSRVRFANNFTGKSRY